MTNYILFNLQQPKEVSVHYRDLIPSKFLTLSIEIKDAFRCFARSEENAWPAGCCWLALLGFGWTNCEILVTQLQIQYLQSGSDRVQWMFMAPCYPCHYISQDEDMYFTLNPTHWTSFDSHMYHFASCGQLIHFLPLWWAFRNYKIPSLWLLTTFIMFVRVVWSLQLIIGCRHCKEHEHRNVMCDVTDVTDAKMHQTLWSLAVQVLKKSEQFPRQVP
jgi:hypothetical protein